MSGDGFTIMTHESHGQCFCGAGSHCSNGVDCVGIEDHEYSDEFVEMVGDWLEIPTKSELWAAITEHARQVAEAAWDEGKSAERAFQNRPRGDWYPVLNPYREAAK